MQHNIPTKVAASMTVADDEVVASFNLWELHAVCYHDGKQQMTLYLSGGKTIALTASRIVYQQVKDNFKAVVDFKLRNVFGEKIEVLELAEGPECTLPDVVSPAAFIDAFSATEGVAVGERASTDPSAIVYIGGEAKELADGPSCKRVAEKIIEEIDMWTEALRTEEPCRGAPSSPKCEPPKES